MLTVMLVRGAADRGQRGEAAEANSATALSVGIAPDRRADTNGITAMLAFSTPAEAQNYPWCAEYSGSMGGAMNCGLSQPIKQPSATSGSLAIFAGAQRYLMKRRISVNKTERAIDVTIGK
jgi:hypothetical protein